MAPIMAGDSGTGLIIGRFRVLHRGHDYVIRFAQQRVSQLRVLVLDTEGEKHPVDVRAGWLMQQYPGIHVYTVPRVISNAQRETGEFWRELRRYLENFPDSRPTILFGSEMNGPEAARGLGMSFVPVDPPRELNPFTSMEILEDLYRHWQLLMPPAKAKLGLRVAIIGPESTGKSRLAVDLAEHYETVFAAEYARTLVDFQNNEVSFEDSENIARGQISSEDAMAHHANKVLFCDTNLMMTILYCEFIYGKCYPWIREYSERHLYDLYLILDTDVPWVEDPQRGLSDEEGRRAFFDRLVEMVQNTGRPYRIINGDWDARFVKACRAVDALLGGEVVYQKPPAS